MKTYFMHFMQRIVDMKKWQSGNWFVFQEAESSNPPQYVKFLKVLDDNEITVEIIGSEESVLRDSIRPIILNEQLIKDLGFKELDGAYLHDPLNSPSYRFEKFVFVIKEGIVNQAVPNIKAKFGYSLYPIEYFHQLQNLLGERLKDVELNKISAK